MGLGLGVEDHHEPRSTPKLSLSRLPCKPKHPIQMLTPPLHPSLSIPFQWEEAPGRPRFPIPARADVEAAARTSCFDLDLPPRLLLHDDPELTMTPSPPALSGGASLFACWTFSFRGSGRFRRLGTSSCGGSRRRWRRCFELRKEERGAFDLSQTLGDFFMSEKNKVHKMARHRRVRSLFTINSNLLDIYARFKQAIPWRRRR
ncbi:hypothetical protein AAHA92_13835 [Salvia divinorum]|uniref:Uncharacterized protein n=1 Tax=Salvia divinorum TaxID=28513 RepID=A0ABD1HDN5_SALDI